MTVFKRLALLPLAFTLVVGFQLAAVGQSYQAAHFCNGYVSPGTVTISCQFDYTNPNQFNLFSWIATLPEGWVVTDVTGGGFSTWDIWFWEGSYYLSPNGAPPKNATRVTFVYTVSVPPGITGPVNILGEAEYWFEPMRDPNYVRATPDPLVITDTKTLEIVSPYGAATPAVGIYTNLTGTAFTPGVSLLATVGPTQYVCSGWSMTGAEPASGATNSFAMTLTNNAVLTWNWSVDNVAPAITNELQTIGFRTKANTLAESVLVAQASDPDAGDSLTLTSVNTNGMKGVIVRSGGTLTYQPPAHTDAIIDTFTYTVTDGKGASVVGTVKVKVLFGGTMIRAF